MIWIVEEMRKFQAEIHRKTGDKLCLRVDIPRDRWPEIRAYFASHTLRGARLEDVVSITDHDGITYREGDR